MALKREWIGRLPGNFQFRLYLPERSGQKIKHFYPNNNKEVRSGSKHPLPAWIPCEIFCCTCMLRDRDRTGDASKKDYNFPFSVSDPHINSETIRFLCVIVFFVRFRFLTSHWWGSFLVVVRGGFMGADHISTTAVSKHTIDGSFKLLGKGLSAFTTRRLSGWAVS